MEKNIDNYLKLLNSKGASITSIKNYSSDLKTWLNYGYINPLDLTSLNSLEQYVYYLKEEKNYSINTTRRKIQTLRLFLNFLTEKDIIAYNHLPLVGHFKKCENLPVSVSMRELISTWIYLCKQAKIKSNFTDLSQILALRNMLIMQFCFDNTLRVSEVINLKFSDLDIVNKEVAISSKNYSRTILLADFTIELLKSYILSIEKIGLQDQYLFLSANKFKFINSSITSRSIELIFKTINNKLDVSITPRKLRNSGVCYLIQKGVNDKRIKKNLGLSKNYNLKRFHDITSENIYSNNFFEEIFRSI